MSCEELASCDMGLVRTCVLVRTCFVRGLAVCGVHSSCHLDGRLPLDAEEADVGDADESPALIGPEHDDGPAFRGLGGHVKVGETNAPQVGGQTDEDVPVKGGREKVLETVLYTVPCLLTLYMLHGVYMVLLEKQKL